MKRFIEIFSHRLQLFIGFSLACVLCVTSCTTINELGRVDMYGTKIAARLNVPPEPEIDISYDMKFDPQNPVSTIISVGTNLAKAQVAEQAKTVMFEALQSVDLPQRVFRESFLRCTEALGAVPASQPVGNERVVGNVRNADYLLEIDIRSYGLEARSQSGGVDFELNLVATISDTSTYEPVWRRSINVSEKAHPGLFGLPSEVGTVMSAAALATLTEEQMVAGFDRLVALASVEVARKLETDIRRARSMGT